MSEQELWPMWPGEVLPMSGGPAEPTHTLAYPSEGALMLMGPRTEKSFRHLVHVIHAQGLQDRAVIIATGRFYIAVARKHSEWT